MKQLTKIYTPLGHFYATKPVEFYQDHLVKLIDKISRFDQSFVLRFEQYCFENDLPVCWDDPCYFSVSSSRMLGSKDFEEYLKPQLLPISGSVEGVTIAKSEKFIVSRKDLPALMKTK